MTKREVFQPSGLITEKKLIDEDALGFFLDDDDDQGSVFSQKERNDPPFKMGETLVENSFEKKQMNKII